MDLHVPGGGGLVDALFRSGHPTGTDLSSGDAVVPDVTAAQLDDALAALARGEIEYVGLHDDGAFVQVAGAGAGPYQLEHNPGRVEEQVRVPGGVTDEAARYAMHGFLAGDPAWTRPFPWEDAGLGTAPPPSGGLLKRLFGSR